MIVVVAAALAETLTSAQELVLCSSSAFFVLRLDGAVLFPKCFDGENRQDFTGIHDRFLRDHVSANGCSKTIEMKMFVVNGTILQMKITPIECQNQNIFDTNKIGGSRSWRTTTQTSTNNGNRRRVPKNSKKVNQRGL